MQGPDVEMRGEWHSQCLNCGTNVYGHYCANCGQRADTQLHTIGHLLRDTLEDQLSVNSALPRTLRALFLHPGLLTTEYSAGRIVRYIAPFRLYLIASILFFLVLATRTNYDAMVTDIDRETSVFTKADSALAHRAAAARADSAAAALAADTSAPTAANVPDTVVADTAAADTTAADTTVSDSAAGRDALGVEASDDGINVNFGIADTINAKWWFRPIAARLVRQEARLNSLPAKQVFTLLMSGIERNAPTAVFVMLPLFALILKLLYLFRKRYYVEHFVFSLHVHAFGFLLFTLALLVDNGWFTGPALVWLLFYILFAMRRVYAQSWIMTFVKFGFLGFVYTILLAFVVAGAFLFTAATI